MPIESSQKKIDLFSELSLHQLIFYFTILDKKRMLIQFYSKAAANFLKSLQNLCFSPLFAACNFQIFLEIKAYDSASMSLRNVPGGITFFLGIPSFLFFSFSKGSFFLVWKAF